MPSGTCSERSTCYAYIHVLTEWINKIENIYLNSKFLTIISEIATTTANFKHFVNLIKWPNYLFNLVLQS